MIPTPEQLRAVILAARLPMITEAHMQAEIAERLGTASIAFDRELRLEAAGRIDFAVHTTGGRLGVECKTKGTGMELARQLGKYGRTGLFARLVVITSRPVQIPLDYIEHDGGQIPIEVWPISGL